MENTYYVYLHTRKDTGAVFYVGKGKGRRAFWKNGRNRHWHGIVDKHGFDVSFVAMNVTEEASFRIERETIAFYGKANLANYTDGGEGASGAERTPEQKELMRQKMLGRVFSPETIEKMREAARNRGPEFQAKRAAKLRGRKHSQEHKDKISASGLGRVTTEEAKAKISAFHKGKKKNPEAIAKMAASKSKPVMCHNNNTIYPSMSEAARSLGLKQSHISNVCYGLARHTKGYVFTRV